VYYVVVVYGSVVLFFVVLGVLASAFSLEDTTATFPGVECFALPSCCAFLSCLGLVSCLRVLFVFFSQGGTQNTSRGYFVCFLAFFTLSALLPFAL
jgi:hypothetical protein